MASTRIAIDPNKNMGEQVLEAVDMVRQAQAKFDRIKDIAAQSAFNSDWTHFEQEFGIPAGMGSDFYTSLNQTGDFLHADPIDEFCAKVDQG